MAVSSDPVCFSDVVVVVCGSIHTVVIGVSLSIDVVVSLSAVVVVVVISPSVSSLLDIFLFA